MKKKKLNIIQNNTYYSVFGKQIFDSVSQFFCDSWLPCQRNYLILQRYIIIIYLYSTVSRTGTCFLREIIVRAAFRSPFPQELRTKTLKSQSNIRQIRSLSETMLSLFGNVYNYIASAVGLYDYLVCIFHIFFYLQLFSCYS